MNRLYSRILDLYKEKIWIKEAKAVEGHSVQQSCLIFRVTETPWEDRQGPNTVTNTGSAHTVTGR